MHYLTVVADYAMYAKLTSLMTKCPPLRRRAFVVCQSLRLTLPDRPSLEQKCLIGEMAV
jgi:hypothetical protein